MPGTDKGLRRMVAMTTTLTRPVGRKRGSNGWMPNQHGAWAMLVVPWLLGFSAVVRTGGSIASSLLLFLTWMVGYFAFFAMSQWLRSRLKARYFPAVRAYAVAAAVLGVGLLWLRPEWISWGIVFSPLVTVSLWLSWRRRDRILLSGAITVAAASLLPMVMTSDGLWPWTVPSAVVGISLVCFGYFFGTVLYVKTIIRERGSRGWVAASVAWHLICVGASFALPGMLPKVLIASFFALMAARAWLVPFFGPLRGRNFTAKAVGFGEFGATAGLVLVLLTGM